MNPPPSIVTDLVKRLDVALREDYEERAAIVEFDGNQPREHAEALALLGYHVVGTFPASPDTPPSVDLLMSRDACDRWPRWRDELLAAGGKVWDLSFGPVATVLAGALEPHERPA